MSYVADKEYPINGNRTKAIRLGLEPGLYEFICDYAEFVGMSRSSAVRRLAILGARCEADHGNARMPGSFDAISSAAVQRSVEKALDSYVRSESWVKGESVPEIQLEPVELLEFMREVIRDTSRSGYSVNLEELARKMLENFKIVRKTSDEIRAEGNW